MNGEAAETKDETPTPGAGGPAEPAARLNELVFDSLRDHIVGGIFADGLVLREGEVSEAFGVDRAPVAMALRKLHREGLTRKRRGHGWTVARDNPAPEATFIDLRQAGLTVPKTIQQALARRTWRQRIYPEIERAVAGCLIFGRFRINQSALADHYGVSRTVAHEVLTALERVGLACPERNARWYAGPMTVNNLREFYELRLLLEPHALRQAAPRITRAEVERARDNLVAAQRLARPDAETLNRLEAELHTGLVLKCPNGQMRQVLTRCLLPVILSYGTVVRDNGNADVVSGIPETLADHLQVVECLLAGDTDGAARSLHAHIGRGMDFALPHFANPPPLPPERIPPYMTRVGKER